VAAAQKITRKVEKHERREEEFRAFSFSFVSFVFFVFLLLLAAEYDLISVEVSYVWSKAQPGRGASDDG
jgi:hypothetical protein